MTKQVQRTELPPEHWRALVETIIDRIGLAQLETIIDEVTAETDASAEEPNPGAYDEFERDPYWEINK